MSKVAALSEIADVGLGFKSLQNDFFYVSAEAIKTYGIEKQFLEPIYKISDFDADRFEQTVKPSLWVFCCNEAESAIKGTGALKYIRASAERSASEKKQSSGKALTIREVLEKQGGKYWYSPKAQRVPSRIWLRKGIDTVMAPFLSSTGIVVDQRCNYVKPKSGVSNAELAAVLSSTVFAFSLEINGSTSMGAGVLEAPTTKLRAYPIPNIANWTQKDRAKLAELGEALFESGAPHNWSAATEPCKDQQLLDTHVLRLMTAEVTLKQLYMDMSGAVASRLRMAESRTGSQKKQKTDSVAGLADEIAKRLRDLLEVKPFPIGFTNESAETEFLDLRDHNVSLIETHPMMGQTEIVIQSTNAGPLSMSFPDSVAEVVVRSLLLGNRHFQYPTKAADAAKANSSASVWLKNVENKLAKEVQDSAAGSGYEADVTGRVLSLLGISRLAFAKDLPRKMPL